MNGLFDDLGDVARTYFGPLDQDPANRERSWGRCYRFFQSYRDLPPGQQVTQRELACLHLGFYLASWGMFRGSGPLMQKDHTIYGGVIDLLLSGQYQELWNTHLFRDLLTGKNALSQSETQIELIFDLAEAIRTHISELTIIKGPTKPPKKANCSDTLVTKILMATVACTPAYDTYFGTGLTTCRIHRRGSFSPACFTHLLNVCREHGLWQRLRDHPVRKYKVTYPIMRVVDLYFWMRGFLANQNEH